MLSAAIALLGPKALAGLGGLVAAALAALGLYLKGRSAGRDDERARQAQATLDIVADEKAARESVGELSAGAAKAELSEWSR